MTNELSAYLADFRKDPTLALLPLVVVERVLGVSRPTMKAMQEDGRLQGRSLGKDRYITVRSLLDYLDRQQAVDDMVFAMVEKAAKAGDTIEYAPVMKKIGLDHTISPHRRTIGEILGRISRRSWDDHGIMLTAVVVQKGGKPGKGYFALAEALEGYPLQKDTHAMFVAELGRVYRHYGARAKLPPM